MNIESDDEQYAYARHISRTLTRERRMIRTANQNLKTVRLRILRMPLQKTLKIWIFKTGLDRPKSLENPPS